jgi:hypothetical protein
MFLAEDAAKPAQISSIFLSNNGEDLAIILVVVFVSSIV